MFAGAGQVGRFQNGHHGEVLIVGAWGAGGTRVSFRGPGQDRCFRQTCLTFRRLYFFEPYIPRVWQRGAGGGGCESSTAKTGDGWITAHRRDIRQLKETNSFFCLLINSSGYVPIHTKLVFHCSSWGYLAVTDAVAHLVVFTVESVCQETEALQGIKRQTHKINQKYLIFDFKWNTVIRFFFKGFLTLVASSFSRSTKLSMSVESYPLLSLGVMALSKVVEEICEEMLVEVLRVPLLRLGDKKSLRDLGGAVSPSFSRSSSRWRVFSTWQGQKWASVSGDHHWLSDILMQMNTGSKKCGSAQSWSFVFSAHLMQLLEFLQLPLVLQDQTVSSGSPACQVLLSTHIRHRCIQNLSSPSLHTWKWTMKWFNIAGISIYQYAKSLTLHRLNYTNQ